MKSDLENYIAKRKDNDADFAENFESGYISFKLGVLLAAARIEAGMTSAELAQQLNLDESLIVNIENNPEDIGILTLEKYAKAVGKQLFVEIK
ncbi:MAG: XRE family transcriptional regulator [Nostocales cyanobacterium]|nr:MAG: XRE family transcriptional regulator [Nostocales cyanobacterium]